jgi:hypothetical protein
MILKNTRERDIERGRVHTCGTHNRTIASLAMLPVILMYGGPAVRTVGGGEGRGRFKNKTKY